MKKDLLTISMLLISGYAFSQVGINNTDPKATFDVTAKATDASTAEGIIAPRLTGDQIQGKDANYSADQLGTLIYATSPVTVPNGTKTNNITAAGYYYFDGTQWISTTTAAADIRLVGIRNHISQDAGVGSNGTSAGTGTDNFIVGSGAGNAMTSGIRNTFLGTNVGTLNTAGSKNTIVGMPAFTANTTGEENSGFGISTFRYNTTGNRNTALGAYVLLTNTTGSDNTAVGRYALYENKTGNRNIGIGISAGLNIGSSSNNIAIGNEAWVGNGALSNQISIGNLIYANGVDGITSTISSGNVGVGVKAPSNRLHVFATTNPLRLEGLQAGAITDEFLSVDIAGVVRKITPAAADLRLVGTRNHITQDAGVGSNGTSAGTGGNNIAIGFATGSSLTTGSANVFIGTNAGVGTTTGATNTAIGVSALRANTIGVDNTSLGIATLFRNTEGKRNTSIGQYNLFNNTTGENNVGLGYQTLYENLTGGFNLGLGYQALVAVNSGSNNIGVGKGAGRNISTGTNNIAIGNESNVQSGAASNQLNIGNIIYGVNVDGTGNAISSGNIGIGVKAPTKRLHIANPGGATGTTSVRLNDIPTYADDAAAGVGGLQSGDLYKTMSGTDLLLKIKI